MKKTFVYSVILTCIFIFLPPFMVQFDEGNNNRESIENFEKNVLNNKKILNSIVDSILVDEKGNIIEYRIEK